MKSEDHSAHSGPNWQSYYALMISEGLRPIFHRWATEGTRRAYESIMDELWTHPGRLNLRGRDLAGEIHALPESSYDDSHHRDFFIMLCLGVLLYSVLTIGANTNAEATEAHFAELEPPLELISHEFDLVDRLHGLEAHARAIDPIGEEMVSRQLRKGAMEVSEHIARRIGRVAAEHGWPPDRVHSTG